MPWPCTYSKCYQSNNNKGNLLVLAYNFTIECNVLRLNVRKLLVFGVENQLNITNPMVCIFMVYKIWPEKTDFAIACIMVTLIHWIYKIFVPIRLSKWCAQNCAPQLVHRLFFKARQHKIPTGNRNMAQHTPKHVKSSSSIPMRHAGHPPTTIISVGTAMVEWLMDP